MNEISPNFVYWCRLLETKDGQIRFWRSKNGQGHGHRSEASTSTLGR